MKKLVLLMILSLLLLGACQQSQESSSDMNAEADVQEEAESPAADNSETEEPVDSGSANSTSEETEAEEQSQEEPREENETRSEQPPEESESEEQVIEMEAFQFGFSPDPVVVKKGVPVVLKVTSNDVNHGISIPSVGASSFIPAGETVLVRFTPEKSGEFRMFCNVYCGAGHSRMDAMLVVE